jgi:hypothetical protein
MVGVSILPVAIHNDELYFLFGKENTIEYGIQGYSDFGGGREDETTFNGAIREGCEEMTGFFGNEKQLKKRIKSAGGTYKINHNGKYYSHIFLTDYDANLPVYYNNNHHYVWSKMDNKTLADTKIFEKIEIKWFNEKELQKSRHLFRPFYRTIIDRICDELGKIRTFLKKRKIGGNKTRKNMDR